MTEQGTPTLAHSTRHDVSFLSEQDVYLFNEGNHYRMYDKLGSRPAAAGDEPGVYFGVWAPNAREVSVMGAFNDWKPGVHPLRARGSSGIWEGFIPGLAKGALYKYHIISQHHGYIGDKADPFGLLHEKPPRTASVVWDLDYQLVGWRLDGSPHPPQLPAGSAFHLRSPHRFVDACAGRR